MPVDFSTFRAPFFQVRIGPPDAKPDDLQTLPTSISRLISNFEYTEYIDGGQGSASRIHLSFIEGSTRGIDTPGSVLDLEFSKQGGIRPISAAEAKQNVQTVEKLQEAENQIYSKATSDTLKTTLTKNITESQKQIKEDKPRFLLQERNTIEVTWGYRNTNTSDSNLRTRTVLGTIQRITHRASGDTMPVTEVDALDLGSGEYSKYSRQLGKNYSVGEVRRILASKGKKAVLDQYDAKVGHPFWKNAKDADPARIDGIIESIAAELPNTIADVRLTPEELTRDEKDFNCLRSWPNGMSLHEFLAKDLAENSFAHYYVETKKTKNGKQTIIHVVSRKDFENKARFHFVWKGGNAGPADYLTMKSYQLSLFPEGGDGASSVGVDVEKKQLTGDSKKQADLEILSDQSKGRKIVQVDDKLQLATEGLSITKYGEGSGVNDHASAANAYAGRMDRNLVLEFVTIGIPNLTPGSLKVTNIGARYSGVYYAFAVTHKITAGEGYLCTVQANTNAIAAGGVTAASRQVRSEPDTTVDIKIVGDSSKPVQAQSSGKKVNI